MDFSRPADDGEQENSADTRRPYLDAADVERTIDDHLRWSGIAFNDIRQVEDIATESVYASPTLDDNEEDEMLSPDPSDGLVASFRGDQAGARVQATRRALDNALGAWWGEGAIPERMALRDGLLLLNAGHEMDETHRALLLRSAVYHRRGIFTALSHQSDAERTAVILHDAIVDPIRPFPLLALARLVKEDPSCELWEPYLHEELLTTARGYNPVRRHCAELGLAVLDGEEWPLEEVGTSNDNELSANLLDTFDIAEPRPRWPIIAMILLGLMVITAAVFVWRYEQVRTANMVEVPGGVYRLSNGDGSVRTETVTSFLVDALETTNAEYRRCAKYGSCLPPTADQSAMRPSYFDDPAFDDYPVVFVDHAAAQRYCVWAGKRLPTVDEWQLAASLAPATQRTYTYPWGDRYVAGAANDANAGHDDTLAVGSYHPSGDSPLDLSDMAGNVAEWTATLAPGASDEYWVKGGSFADNGDRTRTDEAIRLPSDVDAEWLGFRCATISSADAISARLHRLALPLYTN